MPKAYKKPTKLKIDLHNIIRQGKISYVKLAIKNNQDLESPEDISKYEESDDDFTKVKAYCPLTLAILYKKTSIAKELIKAKVNLDVKPEDDTQYTPNCLTPLGACIIRKNYTIMKALLEAGADPDAYSLMYGRTFDYDNHIQYSPLMIAIERKDIKAINILLKNGAKKKWKGDYDVGVYDIAVHPDNYNEKIFKKILKLKKKL
jgi:ankyrin repeat protein